MPLVILIVSYLTEDDRWSEMRSAPMTPEDAERERVRLGALGYKARLAEDRTEIKNLPMMPMMSANPWRCPGCLGGCGAGCRRRAH